MIEIASFTSDPETCEYLHDRPSRQAFRYVAALSSSEYAALLAEGWRRFGSLVFRPVCGSCQECVPIRVVVDQFQASKSQRRTLRKNADVAISIDEPGVDADRLKLHDRFHRLRAETHGWTHRPSAVEEYFETFIDNAAPTLEFSYRIEGRLAAVAYVGVGEDGLNSIYAFWEPDFRHRGLGTFDVLSEIEHAKELGKSYVYLGFLVAGCKSLEYKSAFRPHQFLRDGQWRIGS